MLPPLPFLMRQVVFDGAGAPEVMKIENAPLPLPQEGEVLIKVATAGVNRPDCLQRAGLYPPPAGASSIPGLEVAGEIVALGPRVSPDFMGRKVCALTLCGGYAEYALADSELCLPVPSILDFVAAAGLPETFFTVYDNVFTRGNLQAGETLLVHGGSSGIGSTAILMAKARGARVFVTIGSEEKAEFCKNLGADAVILYKNENFADRIKELTDNLGVDVILDMVGGSYTPLNITSLAQEGRLVQIAFLEGAKVQLDLRMVMAKRLMITGSTLRPRPLAFKRTIARALLRDFWPLLESGSIRPAIFKVFPLAQAREAHELMESSSHCGKIILDCSPEAPNASTDLSL